MLAEHYRIGSSIVFEAADAAVSGIDGSTPTEGPITQKASFRYRSQVGQLEYLTTSTAAMASLAEQYAGLPMGGTE